MKFFFLFFIFCFTHNEGLEIEMRHSRKQIPVVTFNSQTSFQHRSDCQHIFTSNFSTLFYKSKKAFKKNKFCYFIVETGNSRFDLSVGIIRRTAKILKRRYSSIAHHLLPFDSRDYIYQQIAGNPCDDVTPTSCQCRNVTYSDREIQLYIGDCNNSRHVFIPNQTMLAILLPWKHRHKRSLPSLRHKRHGNQQPRCQHDRYDVTIQENLPIASPVATINVNDQSSDDLISFRMAAMTNVKSDAMFAIDPTSGHVVTTQVLDREVMTSHSFNVYVTKAGAVGRCVITIDVIDVNDNKPQFTQSRYDVTILENLDNGTYVLQVHADDADAGANGDVIYSIWSALPDTDTFKITPQEGAIYVNTAVDREQQSRHQLVVCARDRGIPARSNTVNVTIRVDDVNDNEPRFTQAYYVTNIGEDADLGSDVITVTAVDDDSGANGEVKYSLLRGNRHRKFRIDPRSGKISLNAAIDFESDHEGFELFVRAYDGGSPPRTSVSGPIKIRVDDVNDNAPRFVGLPYHQAVAENTRVGAEVLRVQAVDDDYGEASRVSYFIDDVTLPFRITDSGRVMLTRALDFETQNKFQFKVRATDGDDVIAKSTRTDVIIDVTDVNDNAPKFEKLRYKTHIAENSPLDAEVLRVRAFDADSDVITGLNYAIVGGNKDGSFDVVTRGDEGVVLLVKQLDFNRRKYFELQIAASDGKLSGNAVVAIDVTDTNSYSPVFNTSHYETTLREDVAIGSDVIKVHASDLDNGENARVTYCIVTGDCEDCCSLSSKGFKIDPDSGLIVTSQLLDYEKSSYSMIDVRAEDHGDPQMQDHALVMIYLEDVNDNPPVFSQKIYRGSILENIRKKKVVLEVKAEDEDSKKNSQISYRLLKDFDGDGDFEIDIRNGKLSATKMLDRENIDKYELVVVATDSGKPQLTSSATIIIDVLDVDDNQPIFESDHLIYDVPEDLPPNSEIAQIQAHDPDVSSNNLTYEIGDDPYAVSMFSLDRVSGRLVLIRQLDFEKTQNYSFIVKAISGDFIGQVEVNIRVTDCNDNRPIFADFEIHFNNYRTNQLRSFYSELIGRVPAHDPDVTDRLRYKFISGNDERLLLMDGDGRLKLNNSIDSDRQFTVPITILVSDGLHDVNATCLLHVIGISDVMLSHSITVRVLKMNANRFLSELMYKFTSALALILQTDQQNIFIFNIQNDTDVDREVLNVSFSALQNNSNNFFSSKHLQDQVYLNRSKLTSLTKMNVLPFDDNICLREPCQNYKRCVSILSFNSSAPFISSSNMFFRPIYPVHTLKCECPIGFTNEASCTDEINLCYSKPCLNGGTCQPLEGDFYCECSEGFTGKDCNVDLKRGSCTDHPGICKNDGECVDLSGGGFECRCGSVGVSRKNEFTSLCELRSRQFKAGDFLILPGIINQWHFELSISFSTIEANGLIFYNGRLNQQNDFLALELVNGQIHLNFSTGQQTSLADPHSEILLNDGDWHTVHLQYFNERKAGDLRYGVLSHYGPSQNKVVIVTIDPHRCEEPIKTSNCSRRVQQTGVKKSLDLTSPLLLGGVPDLPEEFQVRSKHFTGCLRDLVIDGRRSDLSRFIANRGSKPGCDPMRDHCDVSSCYNGGQCRNRFNGFSCACAEGTTGRNCERRSAFIRRLFGKGLLRFLDIGEVPEFDGSWNQEISFRTFQKNSIINEFHFQGDQMLTTRIEIYEGFLKYSIRILKRDHFRIFNISKVSDGDWHHLQANWLRDDDVINIRLEIDFGLQILDLQLPVDDSRLMMTSLTIGGSMGDDEAISSFDGCIQNAEFGNFHLTSQGLHAEFGATPLTTCSTDDVCASSRCPDNSDCVAKWTRYECRCHPGYVGVNCRSICELEPCPLNARCLLDSNVVQGYICRCNHNYIGPQCQFRLEGACPPGWHGNDGLCAPCNCSSLLNFDLICDSRSGACKCAPDYYYHSPSSQCLPCNCYPPGSLSSGCQDETGSCSCRQNVYGPRCDLCSYEFSEAGRDGCQVMKDKSQCPKSRVDHIVWPRTPTGGQDIQKCPIGATGFAMRLCRVETGWQAPVLTNCTSDHFIQFFNFLRDFKRHKIALTRPMLIRVAENLREAAEALKKFYGNDVEIGSDVIKLLLNYENSRSGFELITSRDNTFTENLVRATSALMNNVTNQFWYKGVGKRVPGLSLPLLLMTWEDYVTTLLLNLDRIHLNRDVDVIAPNFHFHLKTLQSSHDDVMGLKRSDSPEVAIRFPADIFAKKSKRLKRSISPVEGAIAVGIAVYRGLEELLPVSMQVARKYVKTKLPAVNSHVMTFVVSRRGPQPPSGSMYFDKNGILFGEAKFEITFKLLQLDHIVAPTCVFWNYSSTRTSLATFGSWSPEPCKKSHSNRSHVTCRCSKNGTVAVITETQVISVMSQASVYSILIVAVAVSALLLATLVISQICLSSVTSVRSVVNRNIALSFAFAILCFLTGVQQTSDVYWCMAFAVALHFLVLSNFSWMVVDVLHIYRTLVERRNVNNGQSRVYYLIGWILPSVITALSLGLEANGFGNHEFCWLSFNDLLIWSFIAPTLISLLVYLFLFGMSLNFYLVSKRADMQRDVIKYEMKTSFIICIGCVLSWLLASCAVNFNSSIYFYLFAFVILTQSTFMFLLNLWKNVEMREGYKTFKKKRIHKKQRFNQTFEHLLSPAGRTPDTSLAMNSHMMRFGDPSSKPFNTTMMLPDFNDDLSDSYDESDDSMQSSRSSMSLDSSSYSDADDEDDEEEITQRNTLRNIRNCRVIPPSPPNKKIKSNSLHPRFSEEETPTMNGVFQNGDLEMTTASVDDKKIPDHDEDENSDETSL